MHRNLAQFARNVYDLLVVGGGIYGVCIAWDAALRGLSVALIDQADFGHATSFNSLKVIHGGLRYLQHLDIRRMRASIYERTVLMRIAPHLVQPLPFVMPTYGQLFNSRAVLSLALRMHDLVGFDRNRGLDPANHLPPGRVMSRAECLQRLPGIHREGLTGGALWYEGQLANSERLLLAMLKSAVRAGAEVANYVEARQFLRQGARVIGVKARDTLCGDAVDIRAQIVVNACGPWVNRLWAHLHGTPDYRPVRLSKAMNLVIDRLLIPQYAVGISSRQTYRDSQAVFHKGARLLFIVPWRRYSLIGTTHGPFQGEPHTLQVSEAEIEDFIAEINAAYPAANLKREDVCGVYRGLLPRHETPGTTPDISLTKRFRIVDHARVERVEGLISVVGVKYTESRHVATQLIDLVGAKLGRKLPASKTAVTPVDGGQIDQVQAFRRQAMAAKPRGLSDEVLGHLMANYGAAYPSVLQYVEADPSLGQVMTAGSPVTKAEVVHAVRQEMAMKLTDVVLRRTELGLHANLSIQDLQQCAALMAQEYGWDGATVQHEVEETRAALRSAAGWS